MVVKRILISFVFVVIVSLCIASLGLVSTTKINRALGAVIDIDLPASEVLGNVGRHMMSIKSSVNALLNPNLTIEQRRIFHEAYSQAKTDLNEAMGTVSNYISKKENDPHINQVTVAWRDLEATSRDWLKVGDEVMQKYSQWEATSILNPAATLMSLEKYRADHFYLIRRLSEMIKRGEVMGAEVGSNAGLCAFGRWQTSFDNGEDSLAGSPVFQATMNNMKTHHNAFHATAAAIYQLIKENSQDNQSRIDEQYFQLLTHADQVIGNFDILVQEVAKARNIYHEAAASVSEQLLPISDRLQEVLDSFITSKRAYDLEESRAITVSGQRFILTLIIGTILALLLLTIFGAMMLRNIKRTMTAIIYNLSEAAHQVDQSSSQLLHTSNTLAEGASENAASLEETNAALEELSSMTRRNDDNISKTNALMNQTIDGVGQADSFMNDATRAMSEISTSGSEIGKIIKTIDEIAFQTNLLALNAAVEAARAGEAGSGFAVVADEVRNLAIRSAEAAKSTSALVEMTINNINSGSAMVEATAGSFQAVRSNALKMCELLAEVAEASKEQAHGIDQINSAMNQMDKVTQSNAVLANESSDTAGKFSTQAAQLLNAVVDLQTMVQAQSDSRVCDVEPQLQIQPPQRLKADGGFMDF